MKKNLSSTTKKGSKRSSVVGADAKVRTKSTIKSLKTTLTGHSTQAKQAKKIGEQRRAFYRTDGWKEYIETPFIKNTSASLWKRIKYAIEILRG